MAQVTYHGGCHCGAVRFEVDADLEQATVVRCNCSICSKKGFLHLIVEPEAFRLLSGEETLVSYRFHTGTAEHRFCGVCGIHAFYTPRSHPDKVDVNVNCLDDMTLEGVTIESFDGQNWEASIEGLSV